MTAENGKPKLLICYFYVILLASYFLANLTRSSTGVVMPSLSMSMKMSAASVGLVSSLYFYAYTLVQPLSGMMCDRKGPLLCCGSGLLVMSIGIAIFAMAPSPFYLGVGRFLAGLGAAGAFNGTLVYQANAFSRDRYALLAAISVTIGHFGGVVSVTPLGMMLDSWGRKGAFGLLALSALVLACLMLFGHRQDPVLLKRKLAEVEGKAQKRSIWFGFQLLSASRPLQVITVIWSACLALQMILVALWGVSWLTQACGFSVSFARWCMTLVGIGVMVGAQFGGWIGTRFRGSRNALGVLCLGVAFFFSFLLGAATRTTSTISLEFLSVFLGVLMGACNVVCNSNMRETVGPEIIGSAIGAVNTIIFLVVMLSQYGSGYILGFFKTGVSGIYSSLGYLTTLSIALILFILSAFSLSFVKTFRREGI